MAQVWAPGLTQGRRTGLTGGLRLSGRPGSAGGGRGSGVLPELERKFSVRVEEPAAGAEDEAGPLGVAKAQFHDTYILAQAEDALILVDQHAAHERIVLERLKAAMAAGERLPSQLLLLPEVVDLSLTQKAALAGEFESLAKLGLVLEDFGAGVMVREVPALLKDAAIKKWLRIWPMRWRNGAQRRWWKTKSTISRRRWRATGRCVRGDG